ncbi:MAG: cupin domain-containing protein [Polyangiaceae bacterium]|nr:cupin domain-containing protein [Polyangiaceae bacterium]
MIVRKSDVEPSADPEGRASKMGVYELLRYSDAGGLTQYGAYMETLQPGSRSSERHWHEQEDEFLFVLLGEVTIVENDGAHTLRPGDAACWPAGVPNAHYAMNRSQAPCSYLIVGTRPTHDVCHYPDAGRVLHTEGETWRLVADDGSVIKSGRT